jgi:hypothetical protein
MPGIRWIPAFAEITEVVLPGVCLHSLALALDSVLHLLTLLFPGLLDPGVIADDAFERTYFEYQAFPAARNDSNGAKGHLSPPWSGVFKGG